MGVFSLLGVVINEVFNSAAHWSHLGSISCIDALSPPRGGGGRWGEVGGIERWESPRWGTSGGFQCIVEAENCLESRHGRSLPSMGCLLVCPKFTGACGNAGVSAYGGRD